MPIHQLRGSAPFVIAGVGLSLISLSACSSGGSAPHSTPHGGAAGAGTAVTSPVSLSSSAAAVDGCTMIDVATLSAAVGVHYTAIQDSGHGSICNVTGTSPTEAFEYIVGKEGPPINTWAQQVAAITRDDGTEKSVPGIGDRAIQGGVKEFAVEYKGYIVVVINADVNNPATASTFARTKKIETLLISKL